MDSRPYEVLVAAADRSLLRRLSQFLSTSGFCIRQAADLPQLQNAVESSRPTSCCSTRAWPSTVASNSAVPSKRKIRPLAWSPCC